ncbi:MAG: cob(I)yrinic acid a,c-diamide adenosyltransferase [Lactobacillus sp.]|jgi:cob(I)alamin adenosyltransferase|nr:MAG: cob(I)yrinic acid a,c-diamide adenosyltransferase [Lactobacillus sp.]
MKGGGILVKIYTKTGDKGQTRIINKHIVSKDDDRVEAYGSVDELNSQVGFTITTLTEKTAKLQPELEEIQQLLFDAGNDLANPGDNAKRPFIFGRDLDPLKWLESRIDEYTKVVPQVDKFILPGGTATAAALHVDRTVTRRTERRIVTLQGKAEINSKVLVFINRLSDYFFAAARYANFLEGKPDVQYRNSRRIFR